MLDMGFSEEKIAQLETALLKLGTASGCNMKDDSDNKLELLRKVEMKFNEMVEQRQMAIFYEAETVVKQVEETRKKDLTILKKI